jgi:hypothetical protein
MASPELQLDAMGRLSTPVSSGANFSASAFNTSKSAVNFSSARPSLAFDTAGV